MVPKNVEDIYPLTPMQRLMLMHALTKPGSIALANEATYEMHGPLQPAALRTALGRLIQRHPALRTAILWEGLDQPLNVVRARVEPSISELDLSGGPGQLDQATLDEIQRFHRRNPYDLARAPLMRATLVTLGPQRHVFVWGAHHLVMDRWSYGILTEELRILYDALASGQSAELPEPGRFRDYLTWLNDRDPRETERFWRDHLDGVSGPTRWVEGHVADHRGGRTLTTRVLEASAARRLEDTAYSWKLTPATLILGATGLFLGRRARTSDPVAGLTVSGRPPELPAVEQTIGSFVNNVPLRFRLRPDDALVDWLRELQRTQARRQPHEHVSLVQLHDWAGLPPGEALFEGLVVMNLIQPGWGRWRDLQVTPVRGTLDAAYPWVLEVSRRGEALTFTLVHDTAFDGAPGLLDEVIRAAGEIVDAPADAVVGDLLDLGRGPPDALPPRVRTAPAQGGSRDADPVAGPFLAEEFLAIWREVLGFPNAGLDDDFFQLGGTSLQAARLLARVERVTGQALPLSILLRARSVRALLAELDEPMESTGPLVPLRSRGTLAPVVVVPGIGGNVVGLYPLARAVGADRPFYGLQSRGLDGREVPLTSIESIAEDFARQVVTLGSGGIHLVGACWGAAVAFELARVLPPLGVPCLSLSLLDPPYLLRTDELEPPHAARAILRDRLRGYWDTLRTADWRGRLRFLKDKVALAARLARSGGRSESLTSELNSARVRAANTLAVKRYHPGSVRAESRIFFSQGHWLGPEDPRSEWLGLVEPAPEVVWVPGADSGDAITTHAHLFAGELDPWFRAQDRRPDAKTPPGAEASGGVSMPREPG